MSANGETHVLRRLDDPWKLGLWELDIALPFAFCMFMGMLKGTGLSLFMGVAVGFFIAQRIGKIKAARHPKYFRHFMYWVLPPVSLAAPKALPPSSQHEMVG